MKQAIYFFMLFTFLITSCASKETVRYTIASRAVDCIGVAPQKCMLVKKDNAPAWEYFYSNIEGFNYEEGHEYVLDIKEQKVENPPADASSIKYILVKEVSKVAKQSENLPEAVAFPVMSKGYQCTGKVLAIEKADIGKGGAAGKISATVVKLQVTSSTNDNIKQGDTVYCELIVEPKVQPVEGREYVFKAKNLHPAHAKGVYLLETDVLDLTR